MQWHGRLAREMELGTAHLLVTEILLMKMEFLPDGAEDCPLVRLFEYRQVEVERLCQTCRELADGKISEFALHERSWIDPVAGCQFVWRAHRRNVGVKLPANGSDFVLLYNDEAWRELAEKLESFSGEGAGDFNWLTNEGDVNVLISWNGTW